MRSKYYWCIDAGHGGIKNGRYVTAPAKMVTYEDGYTIYEGQVNRSIADKLQKMLNHSGIDYCLVYDDIEDTPLSHRAGIINRLYEKNKNVVSLSIHCNAGGGSGIEIYTSKGETEADKMAEVMYENTIRLLPQFIFRPDNSDKDHDKEERLYMVGYPDKVTGQWKGPKCPAILYEALFMDNRLEAEYLNSELGQHEIANVLFQSIKQIENVT